MMLEIAMSKDDWVPHFSQSFSNFHRLFELFLGFEAVARNGTEEVVIELRFRVARSDCMTEDVHAPDCRT
jgi:hypothetical protein